MSAVAYSIVDCYDIVFAVSAVKRMSIVRMDVAIVNQCVLCGGYCNEKRCIASVFSSAVLFRDAPLSSRPPRKVIQKWQSF